VSATESVELKSGLAQPSSSHPSASTGGHTLALRTWRTVSVCDPGVKPAGVHVPKVWNPLALAV